MSVAGIPAGRELDALVEEKVMGQPVSGSLRQIRYANGRRVAIPRYSSDIAAAWQVVEKMGAAFDGLYPSRDPEDGRSYGWVAITAERTAAYSRRGHVGKTAPLAICRAALAALEAP